MKPVISLCLATYNPRQDYLERALEGVRKQTLSQEQWEFLLIDNNSQPSLEGRVSLSGLPKARIVVEKLQGLSHARRRGFQEAQGDLIINLDDDAVLDPGYFAICLRLADQYPFIGVFGSQMTAEFEEAPIWPKQDYYAAERMVHEDIWSNDREHIPSTPWGAGSVVTKKVAEAYTKKMLNDPRWSGLGRAADKLLSCEDIEIAMTACDLGLGKGVFKGLKFKHLIQKSKMTEEFLCKNAYGNGYSFTTHNWLRFGRLPPKTTLLTRINRNYRLLRMSLRRRRQEMAKDRGIRDAARDIKNQTGFMR
jgi:glycosyltransferase involved in cell wall biosynthesis